MFLERDFWLDESVTESRFFATKPDAHLMI
jgi:hypothetical protein